MKNLINNSVSGIIALFVIFAINTQCVAQSTILAEQYAYDASAKMMRSYCPQSGTDASVYVSKVEYDYTNDRYYMKITAIWYGKPCWLCDAGTFRIEGILQVNHNGSNASFNPTYKNSFVTDNEYWTKFTRGAIVLGALIAVSSSDN